MRRILPTIVLLVICCGCRDSSPSVGVLRLKTVVDSRPAYRTFSGVTWMHYTCYSDSIFLDVKTASEPDMECIEIPMEQFSFLRAIGKFSIWLPVCTYRTDDWFVAGVSKPTWAGCCPEGAEPHLSKIEEGWGISVRKDFGTVWTDVLMVEVVQEDQQDQR